MLMLGPDPGSPGFVAFRHKTVGLSSAATIRVGLGTGVWRVCLRASHSSDAQSGHLLTASHFGLSLSGFQVHLPKLAFSAFRPEAPINSLSLFISSTFSGMAGKSYSPGLPSNNQSIIDRVLINISVRNKTNSHTSAFMYNIVVWVEETNFPEPYLFQHSALCSYCCYLHIFSLH